LTQQRRSDKIQESKEAVQGGRLMERGIGRRKIIAVLATVILVFGGIYAGVLRYWKSPECDVEEKRLQYPVAERDYSGITLKKAKQQYEAVVLCRLQDSFESSARVSPTQKEYTMRVEECLSGTIPDTEFTLCMNGLPKEEAGTEYLVFLEALPAEWNVEHGYSAPEEWTYYVTEDRLLLSGYTSVYWTENKQYDPSQFDGCSLHHFLHYLNWML
jgi:hypothetical protein